MSRTSKRSSAFPLLKSATRSRTVWSLDEAVKTVKKPAVKKSAPLRGSGDRPALGRPGGRPKRLESRRRAPSPQALWQYLCGKKTAGVSGATCVPASSSFQSLS